MYIRSAPHTCTPPSRPRPLPHAGPQPGGVEGAGQHPAVRDGRRGAVCGPGTLQRALHPGELWLCNHLKCQVGCAITSESCLSFWPGSACLLLDCMGVPRNRGVSFEHGMRPHLQVGTAARLAQELSHVCSPWPAGCSSPCGQVNCSSPAGVLAHHRHRPHLLLVCTFRSPCAAVLCGGGLPLAAAHIPGPNVHDCQQVSAPGAGRFRQAGVVEVQDAHELTHAWAAATLPCLLGKQQALPSHMRSPTCSPTRPLHRPCRTHVSLKPTAGPRQRPMPFGKACLPPCCGPWWWLPPWRPSSPAKRSLRAPSPSCSRWAVI